MLRLSWFISLGISLLGVLIVGSLYGVQSENSEGSFGFIGIVLIVPFLLLSLFITFRYFMVAARNATDRLMKIFSFIGGFILIGVLIYFVIDYKDTTLSTLGLPSKEMPSLNGQTYSIYFNIYTFGLIHSFSGLLGGFLGLVKGSSNEKKDDF